MCDKCEAYFDFFSNLAKPQKGNRTTFEDRSWFSSVFMNLATVYILELFSTNFQSDNILVLND